jgi:hypothetical protein
MKKLTDEQVVSFIQSGKLRCHDDNGTLYTGGIRFYSEQELKYLVDFPKELKRPIENENNEIQYFVPDSLELFSSYEIIKHKKLFNSWLQAAVIHHADQADYAKKESMLKLGKKLLSLVYDNYKNTSILSKKLWDNLNFGYGDRVAFHANNFSSMFETIEDVFEFENILPDEFKSVNNKTRRNIATNIIYYTYLKAVNKLADDYSIAKLPLIVRSRLQQSNSESCHLETLNLLRKYKFNSTEDIVRKFFNTSTNTKVVDKARHILIENNSLKLQTKTILSEEDFTIYHKVIEVNFLALKEKVNDNLLVCQTLVQLMYHYMNSEFSVIKKSSASTVDFEIRTKDINELALFKDKLTKCLIYTFNIFLTNEIFEKFSQSKRGNRIGYENHKQIQNDFKSGFEKFCIQELLQHMLILKDEKEKVQKI